MELSDIHQMTVEEYIIFRNKFFIHQIQSALGYEDYKSLFIKIGDRSYLEKMLEKVYE